MTQLASWVRRLSPRLPRPPVADGLLIRPMAKGRRLYDVRARGNRSERNQRSRPSISTYTETRHLDPWIMSLITLADGEVVNVGPIRTRILEDGGDTGQRLGVVEVSLQPGTAGPPQHIHREHDETFF